MSIEFPTRYNHKDIEGKWQRLWEEWGIYRFDREDRSRPVFVINTPPPYPSGDFHVGNALNHSYIDFVARYKRMRGYNVLFPQGWDCHGLPTEVRVEKAIGKTKRQIPSEEFLRLCRKYTEEWIKPMKKAIKSLGCSIDWTTEYKTMDPDYWRRTQLSFIEMYRKGYVYLGEHPVHWCPRCETALAEAEVEYVTVIRNLYYFNFKLDDGTPITVASTRPELIPACVALLVHPDDERYKNIVGRKAETPLYGRIVPILSDPDVDPSFGTGIVMVCTYGDKADVKWQKRYNLPVIKAIDERGLMTDAAGFLKGLTVEEARKRIVEKLREKGLLVKVEKITSNIGTCWRCHTPVEIIPARQWFVKTRVLAEKVLKEAREKIKWIPAHAYKRLEDWVKSLDWDWTISRKRVFGTPFPVWYCERGHIIVADPSWLPIDPRKDKPPIDKCPHCGGKLIPETDVMDTWMDSSISAAVHAGWPDNLDERLLPADLQPNGYDIIRTWDYYLIVRGLILFGKPQFKVALINGMVRGTDGRMMHKSYGNYVSLLEVIEKYGADAFRLWVAQAASTGSDVRFNWNGLEFAKRFLVKLWNAARLSRIFLEGYEYRELDLNSLRLTDKWILGELDETIVDVTNAMEEYDFIRASSKLIDFVWHKLCDHYLEAIKYRMNLTGITREAVSYTLYTVLLKTLAMLSVFTPHICDEIYYRLFKGKPWKSITIAPWPKPLNIPREDVEKGKLVIRVIAEMRRVKHDKRIPLNAPIEKAVIYVSSKNVYDTLLTSIDDIKGTLRIKTLEITLSDKERGKYSIKEYPEITFTM
ncbi:MAG TPA: valine--tRNA ligase [Desulfurococcales archaeon]|nr:valine--tRNA ligase [Desulfurococcales archaeon]